MKWLLYIILITILILTVYAQDNCQFISNTDQLDSDKDGIGDVCDLCTDIDGDGFGDPGFAANTCLVDNCPNTKNPGQEDADGDGMGDACEVIEGVYAYGITATNAELSTITNLYKQWKSLYVTSEGAGEYRRVKRPESEPSDDTVSEGIGYGMLLAVYMDDQDLFNDLWNYKTLYNDGNGLMHWKIDSNGDVTGENAATDADADIAFSLVMADRRWGSGGTYNYSDLAIKEINKIKIHEINITDYHLKPGDAWDTYQFPSYYATAWYRIFGKVTGDTEFWDEVISTCNQNLEKSRNNDNGLAPETINHDGSRRKKEDNTYDNTYGYNSCRIPWRYAIDYVWNGDLAAKVAKDELSKLALFFNEIGATNIKDGYNVDEGSVLSGERYHNAAFTGPAGCALMVSSEYQSGLDSFYTQTLNFNMADTYYSGSLQMLTLLLMSGNFPNDFVREAYCGDGILDSGEECDDGNTNDCDLCSNSCTVNSDRDGDGIANHCDNCPNDNNPGQEDSDGDGIGDACDNCPNDADNDIDGDGVCGDVDNCPTDANTDQADEDGDGMGDVCDSIDNCQDGIQNNGETGVDCGGPCQVCPTCSDGIQNQGEEGIDCGGPCPACPCSDGTLVGSCSTGRPKYCDKGFLIDRCQDCDCPTGQECLSDGSCATIDYYFVYVPVGAWPSQEVFEAKATDRANFFTDISPLKFKNVKNIFVPLDYAQTSCDLTFTDYANSANHQKIKNCADMYADSLGIGYERGMGLSSFYATESGGCAFPGNKVAWASMGYVTADRPGIVAHELAHTYYLCDEYNYQTWLQQNNWFQQSGSNCPNSWPTQCTSETELSGECLGNTPTYRDYSGPSLSGVCGGNKHYSIMGWSLGYECGFDKTGGYEKIEQQLS